MKIVVLDGYAENPGDLSWAGFEELGELTVYDRTPADQIVERIGDAEAVILNKTPLSAETIRLSPSIRYIGVLATGYNVVDVAAAAARGIPVCNIPAYGTGVVAQFTIALLLELCHHVGHHDRAVHEGRWASCPDFCFWDRPMTELAGKTMGIIGYGRIGQTVAGIARALGMKVLAHTAHPDPARPEQVPLDTLLAQSDVISLHCPLFADTEGIICRENIAKMKDRVLLLNTSRGQLIVEEDLAEALASGKVRGAAVDVVSTEPISPENPLLGAENCIITPHIAWAAQESRARLMDIAVENLRSWQAGRPQNLVNTPRI